MKVKNNLTILFILFLVFVIFFIVIISQRSNFKNIFTSRAESVDLSIKIALQGTFDPTKNSSFKSKIILYSKAGKQKELIDQLLKFDSQNIFKVDLNVAGIDLNQMYAVSIKPDKYIGKIFCNKDSSSNECTVPQIIFHSGQNALDLTKYTLLGGDLSNQDGKVDSYDISKIISDIGKTSSSYLESDINADLIINALDYSLAYYSLSKNASDDKVNINFESITPTPTLSATATPATSSPTATTIPEISNTPTPKPTSTPVPPTNTPVPTTTSAPTPTPSARGGTCNGTLNGKAYVSAGIFGNQCRKITNETHHYCVTDANDCNSNKCIDTVISTVKQLLPSCSNGIATLDEQKTRSASSCTTQYVAGNCTAEPAPNCEDNREKC